VQETARSAEMKNGCRLGGCKPATTVSHQEAGAPHHSRFGSSGDSFFLEDSTKEDALSLANNIDIRNFYKWEEENCIISSSWEPKVTFLLCPKTKDRILLKI
jgi:hypothetical protein